MTAALEVYIQRRKQLELLSLFGTIDYDADYDYKMTTMVTPMRRATDRLARRCAIGLALACIGLAALVLVGWIGGIESLKRVVPGYVAMVPTTAICLLLIGGGLFLTLWTTNRHAANLSMALAASVAAIVVTIICFALFGKPGGLEQLLSSDWHDADVMSAGTQIELLAAAFCLYSLSTRRFWSAWIYTATATGGVMVASVAILGYLFGSSGLYEFFFSPMAVHTAAGFLNLHVAFLLARPSQGWVGLLLGRGSGSERARRVFPIIVTVPIGLCFVVLEMTERGLLSANLRLALLAIAMVALSTLTLLVYARGENRAEHLAHHDPLTGLANRIRFHERLDEAISAAPAGGATALLLIDLDHFKQVNDTMGHVAGDELLRVVADRLQSCLSGEGTAARIGGDEFAVVLVGKDDCRRTRIDVQRIFDELMRPVLINDRSVDLSVSLGVALFPQDAETHEDLVIRADLALYEAKSQGRATYRFYGGNLAMPTSSHAFSHALLAENPARTRIGGDCV